MSAVSRIVRISDINFNIPPAEVKDEIHRIFSRDFTGFDIVVVKPRIKKIRLAFLTFQSIRDADRAVKMHERLKLFGDPVRVAFDLSRRKNSGNHSPTGATNFSSNVSDLLQKAKSLISHYNDESTPLSHSKPKRKSNNKDIAVSNASSTKMPPSQTLFIGKLEKSIKKKEIENALKRFGIIESIMIYNHNPHRVFAFVKFFNLFMARKALKSMVGKKFLHCDCLFGYGQTAATNILWIGGIGPWIDIILLKKKFEEFGEVKNVEWPPDKNFAYVEFDSIRSARRALEKMRGTVLGKKRISLDYSDRSQMTSNINYSDSYLGGDSDSEDEILSGKPSRYSASHFDYDSYNKEVDVFFDEIYRDHPEHFESRRRERSPSVVERKYEPDRPAVGRRGASPSPGSRRHHQGRREEFEWKSEKYEDDFYAPMDRDFPDRRSPDFEVGLKCTIKNDLYHGRSPEKHRERHHVVDYPDVRKRKDYDDRTMSALPYKKYRSRSRERPSRSSVLDKFSKDDFYPRNSPDDYSERAHDKGYKEPFDFRRSPVMESSIDDPYRNSKFGEVAPRMTQESAMGYPHQKPSVYEGAQGFPVRQSTPEPRDKWYPGEQYRSERSGFDPSPCLSRHSPARFPYKGPAPHAVQMSSGYEGDLAGRNMQAAENELLRKYPSVWTGCMTFKNKCYWTSMSLISGSIPLVNALLNDSLPPDMKLLKITQRLRLDMPEKLVELERRVDMAGRNGSSILLAFPAANPKAGMMPGYECLPLVKLSNFLKETQLAAVVLLPMERSYSADKGILHIFPRCQFSINFLQREAPELSGYFEAGDNLLMIVVKDMSQ